MTTKIEIPVRPKVFEEFLKYLYFDEIGNEKLTVEEILYLCELCEFYQLKNQRIKKMAEQKMRSQIDKFNVVDILQVSDQLGAQSIKKSALKFMAENFELFSKYSGQNSLSGFLEQIDQQLLIEIIKTKAELEY